MLLREALIDPLLRSYRIIYVENVHERKAWTDILLGVLKKIEKVRREDLKVVIHSITDDVVEVLSGFFSRSENNGSGQRPAAGGTGPNVIQVEEDSVLNQVDVLYSVQSSADYVQAAVDVVFGLYSGNNGGLVEASTIVVFLATNGDVSKAVRMLRGYNGIPNGVDVVDGVPGIKELAGGGLVVVSCDSGLEYDIRLLSCGTVRYVVDCGYRSVSWYDRSNNSVNNVVSYPIAKSQAELRRMLASHGDGTGKCFRLYTEQAAFNILTDGYLPEIHGASDLPEILYRLKIIGIDNIARSFPFLTSPSVELFSSTLATLYWLGVIDDIGKVTKMGEQIALLPIYLPLARAIYFSSQSNCLPEMISIISMVIVGGLPRVLMKSEQAMVDNKRFYTIEGDYITLLNIYSLYMSTRKTDGLSFMKKWARNHGINGDSLERARQIHNQLQTAVSRNISLPSTSSTPSSPQQLIRNISNCITKSLFLQLAKRVSENTYELMNTANPTIVKPDTFSVYRDLTKPLASPWVVYEKLIQGSDGIIYMTGINMADRSTLESTGYYKSIRK